MVVADAEPGNDDSNNNTDPTIIHNEDADAFDIPDATHQHLDKIEMMVTGLHCSVKGKIVSPTGKRCVSLPLPGAKPRGGGGRARGR